MTWFRVYPFVVAFSIFTLMACTLSKQVDPMRTVANDTPSGGGNIDNGTGGGNIAPSPSPIPTPNYTTLQSLAVAEKKGLSGFLEGPDQMKVLCSRPGQDKVRQVFCGTNPPTINSLAQLQSALGIGFTNRQAGNNASGGNPGFAITGHSSSLVGRFTSSINPRVIIFSPTNGNILPNFVSMGFVRGEQFAELIANDPTTNQLKFFLVKFKQACNATGECTPGQLLTPAIESNWTQVTIYEDIDLKNTFIDCLQCHQPGGPNSPKIMRMQELQNPWNHFFRDNRAGGQALIADYQAAHAATEDYGGVPGALISDSDPAILEDAVRDMGFSDQDLGNLANNQQQFTSSTIEQEVRASSPNQPTDNSVPGTSATWQRLYDAYVAGLIIAPPYHDIKVTEPSKLASFTQAYRSVMAGTTPVDQLPDTRDVLMTSRLHEMGFRAKPGLTGAQIITQACTQCHNSRLDQTISRALFNVNLATMSRAEKDKAIQRINLPLHDPLRMPPARFTILDSAEIAAVEAELKK